jgi:hypothetical protein
MKKILFLTVFAFILSSSYIAFSSEETDPGIRPVVQAAKEYIAKKYNCSAKSLTTGDVLIGHRESHVDVNHNYKTERVFLRRNDINHTWEVEKNGLNK